MNLNSIIYSIFVGIVLFVVMTLLSVFLRRNPEYLRIFFASLGGGIYGLWIYNTYYTNS